MSIISDFSPILHLPDAIEKHSTRDVVLFARCSTSWPKQQGSLTPQWAGLRHGVEAAGGRMLVGIKGQESGKADQDRPLFCRALERAYQKRAIVVAEDRTRFLRAVIGGATAEPEPREWQELWKMVGNVWLATVIHPNTPLAEVQRLKIERGMQASGKRIGRPRKLTRRLLLAILHQRRHHNPKSKTGEPCGIRSIVQALKAKGLEVSNSLVQRALDLKLPDRYGGFKRLQEFDNLNNDAYTEFVRLEKQGLLPKDILAQLADETAAFVY